MYAAVEFIAPARERLVIPRKAIHQGRVYVAAPVSDEYVEYRLEIRPVNNILKQGELAVIGKGLNEGEKIIVSDVIPVINGLPLTLFPAHDVEKQLMILSNGVAK